MPELRYGVRDWGNFDERDVTSDGVKAQMGTAKSGYSEWRRTVGRNLYVNDVDWLEWRIIAGEPTVVAVLESSMYRDIPEWHDKMPKYCASALARFKRDGQYTITKLVAARFEVPAYFVLWRDDLREFRVCRLSDEEWRTMTDVQYRAWLAALGPRETRPVPVLPPMTSARPQSVQEMILDAGRAAFGIEYDERTLEAAREVAADEDDDDMKI